MTSKLELFEMLNQHQFIFENITKEAAQGNPFAYYKNPGPQGTCFRIADFLKIQIQSMSYMSRTDDVAQIAVGIGKDFNHTAVMVDKRYYIDASMPVIVHDLQNNQSLTSPGRSRVDEFPDGFLLWRSFGPDLEKGPFTFKKGISDDHITYEYYKYHWVWDPERMTNRMVCCKTMKDDLLHEIKADQYTVYNNEGVVSSEQGSEMQICERLEYMGVDLSLDQNFVAFKNLWARQEEMPKRIKQFIMREFI